SHELDKIHHLLRQHFRDSRQLQAQDRHFLLARGIVDPVINAAPLQGIVNLTGTIGSDDYDGAVFGPQCADLRDGDLKVGQQFEQKTLELFICPIQLVNQENGRGFVAFVNCLQERALEQELVSENIIGGGRVGIGTKLAGLDFEELAGIVPLVNRVVN